MDNEQLIKQALMRSGYLLEVRSAAVFQAAGWQASPNYAYSDISGSSTRELDLVASKTIDAGESCSIDLMVLCECINNPFPFVVFRREPAGVVSQYAIQMAGVPQYILPPPAHSHWEVLPAAVGAGRWHHYCTDDFASQYCSFKIKNGATKEDKGLMALHDDAHFGCFRALQQAREHLASSLNKSVLEGYISARPRLSLLYPCIVLQGDLLVADVVGETVGLSPAKRYLVRNGIVKNGRNDVFFVDVVKEEFLDQYINLVSEESERYFSFLEENASSIDATVRGMKERWSKYHKDVSEWASAGDGAGPRPEPPTFAL